MVLASIRVKAERYKTVEAGNAADALTQARQHCPDLVLLDVALPDHDGFWVCRELKTDTRTSHITVIMLTLMVWQGAISARSAWSFGDVTSDLSLPRILFWIPLLFGLAGGAVAALVVTVRIKK